MLHSAFNIENIFLGLGTSLLCATLELLPTPRAPDKLHVYRGKPNFWGFIELCKKEEIVL